MDWEGRGFKKCDTIQNETSIVGVFGISSLLERPIKETFKGIFWEEME